MVSYLEANIAFELLKNMDETLRYDVVKRIATTEEMPFDMVRQVDAILELRAHEALSQSSGTADGNRFETIAQVLNIADPGISKSIMDRLGDEMPQVANEIKALMFVFDDLILVADKDMQKILGEIDKADLALGLKTASDEVRDKLLNNLSKRARESILDEMEMMGPKPLKEVEDAQKNIIELVRSLEEKGDIQIQRGGAEEMV